MADYGVNIAVAVKNTQAITQLSGKIKETGLRVNQLNSLIENFADITGTTVVNSVRNFNTQLKEAAKNLNNVAGSTGNAVTAAQNFVEAQRQANNALREQKQLVRQVFLAGKTVSQTPFGRPEVPEGFNAVREAGKQRAKLLAMEAQEQSKKAKEVFEARAKFSHELFQIEKNRARDLRNIKIDNLEHEIRREMDAQQMLFDNAVRLDKKQGEDFDRRFKDRLESRKAQQKAAGQALMLTGQTSPVGGARNIPGSPAALAAAERSQRLRSASSSALIGGAFPLLFGQGAGASIGGAAGGFGGGMIGGEFGFGLSLVGTQLGSAVDQVITSITNLSSSLQEPIEALNALEAAGIKVDSAFRLQIEQLEAAGRAYEAQALLLDTLAQKLGVDAVAELQALDDAQEETQQHISDLKSQLIVSLLPALTAAAQGVNAFAGVLSKLGNIKIPGSGGKEQTLDIPTAASQAALSMIVPGGPAFTQLANKALSFRPKPELQSPELTPQQKVAEKELKSRNKIKTLENDIGRLTTENLQRNNNLLDATVVANKQLIIDKQQLISDEKINLAVSTKQLDHISEGLKRDGERIKFRNEELTLSNQINAAVEANNKKLANANKKQTREDERQKKAIERRVKAVDREIERTENAFNRASQQLDSITQKHEDKMAFEREYSRLIMEGSTPAAAKQAVELKKQLLELDRGYEKLLQTVDAQIVKAETSLQDLKNQEGVTNEYDEQLKKLDELKEKRDGLKGKKGKAGGAIEEALAPKTFLDKLDDEAERLQGVLNNLVDPANQVIGAANAIGDAFSESFKGVISGSMTAQEALANLFQRTADHFLDMAAEIIAAAIKMQAIQFVTQIIGSMAGAAASGGGAAAPASKQGTLTTGALPDLGSGPSFGIPSHFEPAPVGNFPTSTLKAAEGAFVSRPTNALIGEGGEPEYVIPESKMRESMSRYSRGSRGNSVIPTSGGGAEDSGGGTAVAAPIDVRYSVERINNVDYVTADQFQSGMRNAAEQGAQRGEQNTLRRLQMSGSTRKRLGL